MWAGITEKSQTREVGKTREITGFFCLNGVAASNMLVAYWNTKKTKNKTLNIHVLLISYTPIMLKNRDIVSSFLWY